MSKGTYNKRLKGNWKQGKGYKGDSEERQYAKKEIQESIKHDLECQPTKHKSKKKNEKASLEHWIQWHKQSIADHEAQGRSGSEWTGHLRTGLKDIEEEYQEKFGNKE